MHDIRSAILGPDAPSSPISPKESCRRDRGNGRPSLSNIVVSREERRKTHQRQEERYRQVVNQAVLVTRSEKSAVKVVNLSESGVMIETEVVPWIGERVGLEFEGFDRIEGAVRWVMAGRIGVDLGEKAIALIPLVAETGLARDVSD